jgi:hypothetical protein
MAVKRKIAILLHETDDYPKSNRHVIWALCDLWKKSGIEIEVLKGIEKHPAADLLIPHVDLTFMPEAYVNFFSHYPRVLNRNLRDISKRVISRNLVSRGDACDGPVIVKTNLNCGGAPEATMARLRGDAKKTRSFFDILKNGERKKIDWIESGHYAIFNSLKNVPEAVFTNDSLVVERFLPEYENGHYHVQIYLFIGSCGYCARLGSTEPFVKQKTIVTRAEVLIPDEITKIRRELDIDFGKMDFVIHEGRVVLLDVNWAPGIIKPPEKMKTSALKLAPGIEAFFN